MARVRRVVVTVLAVLGAGYVGVAALAFFGQRALLFPAPRTAERPSPASDVVELPETVLLVRQAGPDRPVVLHFHGNGEQLAWTEWMADAWGAQGVGFVAVEYPGYGLARDKGVASEESIVRAAEAASRYVREVLGVRNERLVVSGQSLGSGPAVELASRGVGAQLVLFTPYTSLPDVGARVLPFLPIRLLMRDRFDSRSKAAQVTQPTLIVHGTADEVVPFELGEALARSLPAARMVRIEGGRHNDIAGRPEVWTELATFVSR
ncbi:MAG: alpha/beta hydrolase [Myxococcaceae bacterium]|nr:alpha/beta hydrolase [Myxococcaceae bacterium]